VSRKRGKKKQRVQAAPVEELLAEGSGPVETTSDGDADAVAVHVTAEEIPAAELAAASDAETAEAGSEEDAEASTAPVADPVDAPTSELAADAELSTSADGEPTEAPSESEAAEAELSGDAEPAVELDAQAEGDPDGDAEGDPAVAALPTSAASMEPGQLKQLVEALVFASDKPITVQRLRQLTRVSDVRRLEQALADLTTDYLERGLVLQQVSGGYQFRTRTQFSVWVQQLIAGRPVRLSRAQLETLAIIAYRQPITRPEIDDIRGVDSSATLKLLMDRLLVRVLGKKEEVGRPMLYGTTKEFLDFFSLGDLRELPTLREYSELSDESRRVMTDRLGAAAGDDGDDGGGEGGDDGGGNDGGSDPSGSDGGSEPGGGMEPGGGSIDSSGEGGSVEASALSEALEDILAADASEPPMDQDHVSETDGEVADVEMASADEVAPFESTMDGEQSMVADVIETFEEVLPPDAVMAEAMTAAESAEPASE